MFDLNPLSQRLQSATNCFGPGNRMRGAWLLILWSALFWVPSFLLVDTTIASDPPLDELEQIAFQNASDFAQDCVVQIETFGGQEIVNKQFVATGPSSGTVLSAD